MHQTPFQVSIGKRNICNTIHVRRIMLKRTRFHRIKEIHIFFSLTAHQCRPRHKERRYDKPIDDMSQLPGKNDDPLVQE